MIIKLLWNLRRIKFGQFQTPSGEPYVGFKFNIGDGVNSVPYSAINDEAALNELIENWRREYYLEKYRSVPQ